MEHNYEVCSCEGCEGAVVARGWCRPHYARWYSHGDPLKGRKVEAPVFPHPVCEVKGCAKQAETAGLCAMHYQRKRKTGTAGVAEPQRSPIPSGAVCSIEGCERTVRGRGFCQSHYMKWYETGDPLAAGRRRNYQTAEESLAARTRREGDCTVWTGNLSRAGYGSLVYRGRVQPAHRVAWKIAHGDIPKGVEIDHKCHNRACVKLEHLREATRTQNMWNLSGAQSGSKTGVRGVYETRYGRFMAKVTHLGVTHYLGTFETLEEAKNVVSKKRAELFGEYKGLG